MKKIPVIPTGYIGMVKNELCVPGSWFTPSLKVGRQREESPFVHPLHHLPISEIETIKKITNAA